VGYFGGLYNPIGSSSKMGRFIKTGAEDFSGNKIPNSKNTNQCILL